MDTAVVGSCKGGTKPSSNCCSIAARSMPTLRIERVGHRYHERPRMGTRPSLSRYSVAARSMPTPRIERVGYAIACGYEEREAVFKLLAKPMPTSRVKGVWRRCGVRPRMGIRPSLDCFVANKEATRAYLLKCSTYALKERCGRSKDTSSSVRSTDQGMHPVVIFRL